MVFLFYFFFFLQSTVSASIIKIISNNLTMLMTVLSNDKRTSLACDVLALSDVSALFVIAKNYGDYKKYSYELKF